MDHLSPQEISKFIEGSEWLTSIFGRWPSFHDAEVIEFNLWRGEVKPSAGRYVFPVLTTKISVWEITPELNAEGYHILGNHTLVTLRFYDVEELTMTGFNHQNSICGLNFRLEQRKEGLPPWILVEFEPGFGIMCSFRCFRVAVTSVELVSKPPQ